MGIQKDSIIYKDDIHEYHVSAGFETIDSVSINGKILIPQTTTKTGYFWIRNNYLYNESAAWNSGTTYAVKIRVDYDSKVYESLQGSNLNKEPGVETAYWREVENGVSLTTFNNINYSASFKGTWSTSDYLTFTLWKVTWDGNQDEILTQVQLDTVYQSDGTHSFSVQEVAGYYKYSLKVSSKGGVSRTTGTIKAKRSANDLDIGDRLRVFSADFKELETEGATNVTVALAKSGRLSTNDFYGGDYGAV